MFQSVKKRTLFFLSILITGLVGVVGNYIRTNYSKNSSLIVPIAHADYTLYTWTDPGSCDTGGGGDGCGGCSGDGSK